MAPARRRRSIIGRGGSGRPWVRGQSCKLTGCVTSIDGASFLPEPADPGREGRTAHARLRRDPCPAGRACGTSSSRPNAAWPRGSSPPCTTPRPPSPASTACPAGPRSSRPAPLTATPWPTCSWIVERFRDAGEPGWTPPGDDELRQHFDDRFLAAIPPASLIETIARPPPTCAAELTVIQPGAARGAGPAGRRAVRRGRHPGAAAPADRAARLRPGRADHRPPGEGTATGPHHRQACRPASPPSPPQACAELGLPALLLAGGEPADRAVPLGGRQGHASLDRPAWTRAENPSRSSPATGSRCPA